MLNTLDLIWERLEEVDLCATAPQGEDKHDPERLTGLATMRRPETAGELMKFLHAVIWLSTSLPRMAELFGLFVCSWRSTWRAPSAELIEWRLTGRSRPGK